MTECQADDRGATEENLKFYEAASFLSLALAALRREKDRSGNHQNLDPSFQIHYEFSQTTSVVLHLSVGQTPKGRNTPVQTLEPCGRCPVRFDLQSCRRSEYWAPSDTLIGCLLAVQWPIWPISPVCGSGGSDNGKQTTFSLLRRLRIITRLGADNATISSAIMIFQVLYSTNVFSGQMNTEPILCALCFSLVTYGLHSVPSFPVFMFWITGTRLAPPDVNGTYCISSGCIMYTLLCSWQQPRRYVLVQLFW